MPSATLRGHTAPPAFPPFSTHDWSSVLLEELAHESVLLSSGASFFHVTGASHTIPRLTVDADAAARPGATASIVGGTPAAPGTFGALAFVTSQVSPTSAMACTGSVIAPAVVLTAAHCLVDEQSGAQRSASGVTVVTGRSDRLAELGRGVPPNVRFTGFLDEPAYLGLLAGADAVVPGVDVTDSLRRRTGGAVDRDELVAVQTPQGLAAAVLRAAHDAGAEGTDDASLVEAIGGTVQVVDGEPANTKITTPHDLVAMQACVRDRG